MRPQAHLRAQAEDRVLQQRTTLSYEEPDYMHTWVKCWPEAGAGDGNRTRVASLEGHASATTKPSTSDDPQPSSITAPPQPHRQTTTRVTFGVKHGAHTGVVCPLGLIVLLPIGALHGATRLGQSRDSDAADRIHV